MDKPVVIVCIVGFGFFATNSRVLALDFPTADQAHEVGSHLIG